MNYKVSFIIKVEHSFFFSNQGSDPCNCMQNLELIFRNLLMNPFWDIIIMSEF
jgi:hypothetical protein